MKTCLNQGLWYDSLNVVRESGVLYYNVFGCYNNSGIYIRSIPVLSRESKKGILDFEFPLVRPTALSVPRFDRSVEVTVGESKGKTLT